MIPLAMSLTPAVIGLLIAAPSIALGYLGYRRSQRADRVAEQAGIATVEAGTVGQVIEGLNDLVERLQDDNRVLRENVDHLNVKLDKIIAQCEELKREIWELKGDHPRGVSPSGKVHGDE